MFWDDDYEGWSKRRRRRPFFSEEFFRNMDKMLRDIEEMVDKELGELDSNMPEIRRRGPFVHGYSVAGGSEGKPVATEFGNLQRIGRGTIIKEEHKPLVDVIETDCNVRVVAELPGVNEKDVKLYTEDSMLTISVDTSNRKYCRRVKLPGHVKLGEAEKSYKNGVLEVTLPKAERRSLKGEPIRID